MPASFLIRLGLGWLWVVILSLQDAGFFIYWKAPGSDFPGTKVDFYENDYPSNGQWATSLI